MPVRVVTGTKVVSVPHEQLLQERQIILGAGIDEVAEVEKQIKRLKLKKPREGSASTNTSKKNKTFCVRDRAAQIA